MWNEPRCVLVQGLRATGRDGGLVGWELGAGHLPAFPLMSQWWQ